MNRFTMITEDPSYEIDEHGDFTAGDEADWEDAVEINLIDELDEIYSPYNGA
jgi:hypothetical protein